MALAIRILVAIGVTATIVLGGCSGGFKYNVETDPGAESRLAAYKTYSWLQDSVSADFHVRHAQISILVKSAVDSQLAKLGYRKTASEPTDFLVTTVIALDSTMTVTEFGTTEGQQATTTGEVGLYFPRRVEYPKGSVLFEIVDRELQDITWRCVVTGPVKKSEEEAIMQSQVDEAIHGIFERFPRQRD